MSSRSAKEAPIDQNNSESNGAQPIPLPESAVSELMEVQRRLDEVNAQLQVYASGLRHGLGVPENWKLDMSLRAFVPPNEIGGDN
jgi:hypothetical protein